MDSSTKSAPPAPGRRQSPRRTAGSSDGDTQTQITAIDNAISRGDKGILITTNGNAVNAALNQAKQAGLFVIALDTAPTPPSVADITYATDNTAAGKLEAQYAAAMLGGKPAVSAMLDLFNNQVVSVDADRDHGFLEGMGINPGNPDENGQEAKTGTYAGGGHYFAADAVQYPGKMAVLGMEAIAKLARGGSKPTVTNGLSFYNTGTALVALKSYSGVTIESPRPGCHGLLGQLTGRPGPVRGDVPRTGPAHQDGQPRRQAGSFLRQRAPAAVPGNHGADPEPVRPRAPPATVRPRLVTAGRAVTARRKTRMAMPGACRCRHNARPPRVCVQPVEGPAPET